MTDFKLLNRFDYSTHQVYGNSLIMSVWMNEYKNNFIQINNMENMEKWQLLLYKYLSNVNTYIF